MVNAWYLIAAIALAITIVLILRKDTDEGYRQAALTCYWEDPGPPMPIPIRPDPRQAVPKEGPGTAPFKLQQGDATGRPQTRRLPPPIKTRSSPPPLANGTPAPLMNYAFDQPKTTSTPAPTLGSMAIPPLVSTTPRPMIATSAPMATAAPVSQAPLAIATTKPIISTIAPR